MTSTHTQWPRQSLLARSCLVAGFICLLAIPLLYSRLTYYRSYLKLVALQAGALLLLLGAITGERPLREMLLPRSRLVVAIWAWLALQLASIALLQHKWLAAAPLAQQVPFCFAAVLLMRILADRPEMRRRLGVAYMVVVLATMPVMIVASALDPGHARFIPFSNRNLAATFLILPIVLSISVLAGASKTRVPLRRLLGAAGVLALGGTALYFTKCLAALVGCATGAFVVALILLPRLRIPLVAGACGGAALVLAMLFVIPGMADRVYDSTAGIRLLIWGGALRAFAHTRGLGSGVGSFFISYTRWELPAYYAHPHAASTVFQAHNYYLHTAVEVGVAGLAGLVWLIVEALRSGWRAWRAAVGADAFVRLGLLGALVGILTDALFSTSPHFVETQINFWLIVAFFGACGLSARPAPLRRRTRKTIDTLSRAVLAFVAAGMGARAIVGGLLPEHDLTRGIAQKEQAEQILASGALSAGSRAPELLARAAARLSRSCGRTYEPEVFIASILRLATIRQYLGQVSEAIVLYEELELLCPGFGVADRNLATLLMAQRDGRRAAERLLKYLRKNRFDVGAYQNLRSLAKPYKLADAVGQAVSLLDYAVPRVRRDPDTVLRLSQLREAFKRLAESSKEPAAAP